MRKVLVIEDEALLGLEIIAALGKAGIEAIGPFPTVDGALAAIAGRKFDAALVDLNLNGIPSFDAAAALKRKSIPFAFVTAYDRIPLPREFSSVPMLRKPCDEQRLLSMTRRLLGIPQI